MSKLIAALNFYGRVMVLVELVKNGVPASDTIRRWKVDGKYYDVDITVRPAG